MKTDSNKDNINLKKVAEQLKELGIRPDCEFDYGYNEGIRQAIILLEFEYAGYKNKLK